MASGVTGLVSVVIDGSTTCVSVDLLMGVVLGSLMAKHVVEHTYDAYYDRFSTAVIFIGGSAAAGIIGCIIGGAIHNYFGIGQAATSQIGGPGRYVQRASNLMGDIQTLQYARNAGSMLHLGPVGAAGRFTGIAIPSIMH